MKFSVKITKFGIEATLWFFSFQLYWPRSLYNFIIFIVFLPFSKIRRKLKVTKFENPNSAVSHLRDIKNILRLVSREVDYIIPTMHAVSKHPNTFGQYKDKFVDKDVVIVGCGPSVLKYKQIAGAIHVGVNRAYKQENIKFDYLFVNDRFPEGMEEVNNYRKKECIKFYGVLPNARLDDLNRDYGQIMDGEENTKSFLGILPKDIKQAGAREFCLSASKRITIFEQRKAESYFAHNILQEPMGDFGGTVFSVLQFLPFAGAKRIYLVGFDMSDGYFYDKNITTFSDTSVQIYSWEYMKIIYQRYYPQIEIISVNTVNLKGLFKDMEQ